MKNGLRVFVYPTPYLESICVAVGVNYGSIDDRDEIIGSAHFLEHMLFKGTKSRDAKQIKEEIRNMGAMWNAQTDFETTIYYLQAYKTNFRKMVELLSDLIINSTIPKKEFELERGPVLNEELIRQDNSQFFFYDHVPQALFKKHPVGRKIVGNRESINRIRREDLLEIYDTYYSPKNIVVTIYGNVDTNEARLLVMENFGGFARKYTKKVRKIAAEPQTNSEKVVRKENVKQSIVAIGYKTQELNISRLGEYAAMLTASLILTNRLWDEVRERRGLSYSQWSRYLAYSTFGFMGAVVGTEHAKVGEVKKLILKEFERLENGEISEIEVKRAKQSLVSQYMILRENTFNMAFSTTIFALMTGNYKFMETLPELIKKVKLADVKKYCKKYIKTESYSSVILKPE